MTREEFFQSINDERAYQVGKWGTVTDTYLSMSDWLLILKQELAKAEEHQLRRMVGQPSDPKSRLVKIATVCCAALENLR